MKTKKKRLAILDMNNGVPNQGMRCIKEIVSEFDDQVVWDVFDVRAKNEIPDASYDIYISSGGPGSPLETGDWKDKYFELLDFVWNHNLNEKAQKKFFFFICHSFQMACEHFQLCEITKRRSKSFGVYKVHMTSNGIKDPIFDGLTNPYYVVDSREWQLIQPRLEVFEDHGAQILSIERIRTYFELERAIMCVRFSDEFVGTQFHPEADAEGMKKHFSDKERRQKVIDNFDLQTYQDMMDHLDDPDKIQLTHRSILPGFISNALEKLHLN